MSVPATDAPTRPETATPEAAVPGARPNQREHILDAALELIATHGAAKMSMRMLAGACGINAAAIYHYFDSKDALVAAVVDERQYGSRLAEVPELDPAQSPQERLSVVFRTMWDGALAEERVWRVLLGEGLRGEPAVTPVGRELLDVIGPGVAAWLRSSIPEIADPDAVGQILFGQMFGGFLRHIFEPDLDVDAICDHATEALLRVVFG